MTSTQAPQMSHTPVMADEDKLQSLKEELEEHKKKLDEMQQRYGSPEAQIHPEAARQHIHSMRDLVADLTQKVQTLIELMGHAGL